MLKSSTISLYFPFVLFLFIKNVFIIKLMIPYKIISPFIIGPLHINMYGIMFALGTFFVYLFSIKEAKRKNIKKEIIEDLFIYLVLGMVFGARLFYVLFYWPEDTPFHILDFFKVWNGGLAFFGGFFGAIFTGYIYAKIKKLDFLKLIDIFTYPVILGHIFGRFGDYLTGGHPGKITDVIWSIYLQGALRHPVVLYEIVGLLIILLIILYLKKFKLKKGVLFSIYVFLYSIQRLFLDIFRIENTDPRFLGLTPTQYIVIVTGIISLIYIITKIKIENENQK